MLGEMHGAAAVLGNAAFRGAVTPRLHARVVAGNGLNICSGVLHLRLGLS